MSAKMKVIQRNPSDLVAADYNPRRMTPDQREALIASVTKFGLVDPVIVNAHEDRKDIIVGGHQRVDIAIQMGLKKVPTVEVVLDEEAERELNIRLNKNLGEWDWDALAQFDSVDLGDWGFDSSELAFEILTQAEDNLPDVLPSVEIQGDVESLSEWVVVRFESVEEYREFCTRVDVADGARTVDYDAIKALLA